MLESDAYAKREFHFRQDPDDIRMLGAEMAHNLTVLRCLAAAAATIIANSSNPELARRRLLDDLERELTVTN